MQGYLAGATQLWAGLDHPKVPRTSRETGSCLRPTLLRGAPRPSSVPSVPRWLSVQQPRAQQLRDYRSQDWQLPALCPAHPPIPAGSCLHVFWPHPSIRRADAPCSPAALAGHPSDSGRPGVCPSPRLLLGAARCRLQSSHPLPALFLPQTMVPIQPPASPPTRP